MNQEMFQARLMASKYIKPAVNLSRVKDCSCTCSLNWDKYEPYTVLRICEVALDPMGEHIYIQFLS